jgi:hypothetical protein
LQARAVANVAALVLHPRASEYTAAIRDNLFQWQQELHDRAVQIGNVFATPTNVRLNPDTCFEYVPMPSCHLCCSVFRLYLLQTAFDDRLIDVVELDSTLHAAELSYASSPLPEYYHALTQGLARGYIDARASDFPFTNALNVLLAEVIAALHPAVSAEPSRVCHFSVCRAAAGIEKIYNALSSAFSEGAVESFSVPLLLSNVAVALQGFRAQRVDRLADSPGLKWLQRSCSNIERLLADAASRMVSESFSLTQARSLAARDPNGVWSTLMRFVVASLYRAQLIQTSICLYLTVCHCAV